LQRHRFEPNGEWISRHEDVSSAISKRQKLNRYPIGVRVTFAFMPSLRTDVAGVKTEEA